LTSLGPYRTIFSGLCGRQPFRDTSATATKEVLSRQPVPAVRRRTFHVRGAGTIGPIRIRTRTASTALANSTSIPSPVVLTMRPRCAAIAGSTSALLIDFSWTSVPSSLQPISRLVGKDDHTAVSSDKPLSADDLFARLDAMPVRQDEMRRGR
jgi:hypothetical protein